MGYVVVILVVIVIALLIAYFGSDHIQEFNQDGQPTKKSVRSFVNWVLSGTPGFWGAWGSILSGPGFAGLPPFIWILVLLYFILKKNNASKRSRSKLVA